MYFPIYVHIFMSTHITLSYQRGENKNGQCANRERNCSIWCTRNTSIKRSYHYGKNWIRKEINWRRNFNRKATSSVTRSKLNYIDVISLLFDKFTFRLFQSLPFLNNLRYSLFCIFFCILNSVFHLHISFI